MCSVSETYPMRESKCDNWAPLIVPDTQHFHDMAVVGPSAHPGSAWVSEESDEADRAPALRGKSELIVELAQKCGNGAVVPCAMRVLRRVGGLEALAVSIVTRSVA